MLLAGDHGVEVLVMVLVEGGVGPGIADPEVDGVGVGPAKSLGGPRDVGVHVAGEGRVLGAKAVVLLLRVGDEGGRGVGDEAEGGGEGHGLDVGRGEAEGGGDVGVGGEGVGAAGRGEVDGHGLVAEGPEEVGVGGPQGPGDGGPVGRGGGGDDAGLVGGDVVAKESEGGRGGGEAVHLAGDA